MTGDWFGPCPATSPPEGLTASESARLAIGSIGHTNGIGPRPGEDWILEVELDPDAAAEFRRGDNTARIDLDGGRPLEYLLRDARGTLLGRGAMTGRDLFEGRRLAPALRERLAASLGPGCRLDSAVPVFAARSRRYRHESSTLDLDLHLYSQVRFDPGAVLLIRTSPLPYASVAGAWAAPAVAPGLPSASPAAWFDEAARLHAENALFLNNHQCYYKKGLDGDELENKLTFREPVDIWGLTVEVDRGLHAGEVPGYIPEYGDEFQKWDYVSEIFEVRAPESERGYISYIPTTDGRYSIKRKWFAEDQLRRRERIEKGIRVDEPLATHLSRRFGVEGHRLGRLRRVRYDVNLESRRTGHVYGIFFDHCTVDGVPGPFLSQCEVEYLRSRVVLEPDESAIPVELEGLTAWVEAALRRLGLEFDRGYYSKLSFLRDRAGGTGRPAAAAAVAVPVASGGVA